MHKRKILIIGEVYVDHHLDITENGNRVSRLGGIFHAIRVCDALNIEFAFAYYAPNYLDKDIEKYGKDVLSASRIYCLGVVNKSPNVMLVGQSDESANQSYDNILCAQAEYSPKVPLQEVLLDFSPSDIMIFPGRYGNKELLEGLAHFKGKIYIDMNYDCEDIMELNNITVETVFLSTSSVSFEKYFKQNSYEQLIEYFRDNNIQQLLIKENRGGSWLYDYTINGSFEAPAFLDITMHSVGVGDVYDIAYIYRVCTPNISHNMIFASLLASMYSKTLQYEVFKNNTKIICDNIDEMVEMDGIRVPWIKRSDYSIYIAAPDFDYVDTKKLDDLVDALLYHNFRPRLPIRENGQINENTDFYEELNIFAKDNELLEECMFMIAILLYNDQGTLVEVGNYQANKKPIILYDPYKKLNNMFLKNSCTYICNTRSDVIDAVFQVISGMVKNGE